VSSIGPSLLDTNIVSETMKRRPDDRVLRFLDKTESSDLYLSVLTLGELRKGVIWKARTDPQGAIALGAWVDGLEFSFADRILGIDAAVSRTWGELSAQRSRPIIDTLLAATAIHHRLTLITRNVKDVYDIPVQVFNPWATPVQ
jgi:predicted nucleic acid-binding protein